MDIHSDYIPNPKQVQAHCAVEQFILYGGAMGGGKSRFLCEAAKQLSTDFPGNFGVVARQSGPALKLSTMEVMFDEVLIPGSKEWRALGCVFNKAEGLLTLTGLDPPSKIWFTGLDADNIERIKSLNLGFFCVDEATEVSEGIFLMFVTRLRRKGVPRISRKGLLSANPEAGWIKRRFVDQRLQNHLFVEANYKDNFALPEDYPELFITFPQRWRDKYLEGKWEAASGMIYKEFDPNFHIIPYKELPPEWRRVNGMDHGQQNPTAFLRAGAGLSDRIALEQLIGKDRVEAMNHLYDHYPVIICDRLYYKPGLVSDHRKGIHGLFKEGERWGPIYADPRIWDKDRSTKIVVDAGKSKHVEYSLADEYREHPFPVKGLNRANNQVNVGLDRVSTLMLMGHLYFMDHPSMEPFIGEAGEIRNYAWKEPAREEDDWPEDPIKRNDHACDGLRYMAMSFPAPRAKGKVIPYNTFEAARKRAISWRKSKNYGKEAIIHKGRVIQLR